MKIKSDNYTVGDLAKFYGVSTDTVRLYDKKGILISEKNDENNYRIYSRDDMIVMDFIVKLRMMDISLTDIKSITGDFDLSQIHDYSIDKIHEIEDEIQRLSALKAKMESFADSIENIEANLGKVMVRQRPVFILRDIKDSIAETNRCFEALGLDTMPRLTVYGNNAFDPRNMKLARDVETRSDAADYYMSQEDNRGITKNSDFPKEGFLVLPSKLCIHTLIKALPEHEYDFLYKIREYAERHNFRLTGEIVNRTVLTKSKGIHCADYYECWYSIDPD